MQHTPSALSIVRTLVADIFEVAPASLTPATRLFTDLPCESIDLLEIGAGLNRHCRIPVDDETAFLRSLRIHLLEADRAGVDAVAHLGAIYPHLTPSRISTVLDAVRDPAAPPVLTLGDIVAYAEHAMRACHGAGREGAA